MRPPRTDVAGLTISEGLLRTAKLEEAVTEGQNVNLASQGQHNCFTSNGVTWGQGLILPKTMSWTMIACCLVLLGIVE